MALSHLQHTGTRIMKDEASYLWKHGSPSDSQEAWTCETVRQPNVNRRKHETRQDVRNGRTMTYGTEFSQIIWGDT